MGKGRDSLCSREASAVMPLRFPIDWLCSFTAIFIVCCPAVPAEAQDLKTPPLQAAVPSLQVSAPPSANNLPPASPQDVPTTSSTSSDAPAAETAPQPSIENWLEKVKGQLESARTNAEFDEATRAVLVENYEALVKEIQARIDRNKQTEKSRQQLARAPAELKEVERLLREAPTEPPTLSPTADLSQLRARLAAAQADLVKVEQDRKGIEGRIERRPRTLAEIPSRLEKLDERIAELKAEQGNAAPPDERPEVTKVRQTLLRVRIGNLEAERESEEVERLALQGGGPVLEKKLEIEVRRQKLLVREIEILNQRIDAAEQTAQEALARKALVASASDSPAIQAVIAKNRAIATDLNNTEIFTKNREKLAARLTEVSSLLDQVQSESDATRERLRVGGSNVVIGSMMRASREALPDLRVHRRRMIWAETTASEAALRKIEIDEALRRLNDIEARIRDAIGVVPEDDKSRERVAQEEALRGHLQTQRELYASARDDYEELLSQLGQYDSRTRKLIEQVEEFDAFIAERILWVPSSKILGRDDVLLVWDAGLDLISPTRWVDAWAVVTKDFFEAPSLYVWAGIILVIALASRAWLRKRLRQIGEVVSKNYVNTATETFAAFLLTVLVSGLLPLAFALAGYRVMQSTSRPDVYAIGSATYITALLTFFLELMRHVCRKNGLATTHFRWRTAPVAILRRNLHWLAAFLLPLTFILTDLRGGVETPARAAGVRFTFVVAMVLLALFLLRVLRAGPGVLEAVMGALAEGWITRTRKLWYPAAVALPLSLALLACLGYTDTALFLNDRLVATLALAVAIILANGLMLRWLYAIRGQLAIEQAKRRKVAESQHDATGGESVTGIDVNRVDLSLVNQQTRRLLSMCVGLAALLGSVFIWSDVVPAFRTLERVTFWSKTEVTWELRENKETGTSALERVERSRPVTLATFAVAFLFLMVTIAASKNLPGLLEILLLARLPLDSGAKFAVTTAARYAISIVGLLAISSQLGIRWDSVQWLAAAFTVGLGFGLQEIVANFVSGLILLWERPIRIGDTVTVADQSGTVSRIQMRATTITDANRKEVVIPNKDFITGRVVNWTLSDRVLRASIDVSIAHGADPARVTNILLDVARRHPFVLREPPPRAIFDRFGDGTMLFVLHAFVDIDHVGATRHDLHTAIHDELDKAKIERANPHRDVTIRGMTVTLPDDHRELNLNFGDGERLRASA